MQTMKIQKSKTLKKLNDFDPTDQDLLPTISEHVINESTFDMILDSERP